MDAQTYGATSSVLSGDLTDQAFSGDLADLGWKGTYQYDDPEVVALRVSGSMLLLATPALHMQSLPGYA